MDVATQRTPTSTLVGVKGIHMLNQPWRHTITSQSSEGFARILMVGGTLIGELPLLTVKLFARY